MKPQIQMSIGSPGTAATAARRVFSAAKKNDSELELLIYDSIGQSFWGGGVTPEAVKQKLNEAGDVSKITLRINSPGGSVFDGSAIYALLTQHKAEKEVFIDGIAASAAFTIAMAGDKIHIAETAMMMCHNAWGFCEGFAPDMNAMAELLTKISHTVRDVYVKRCGMTTDEVQKLMDAETFMSAAEAVENGFADDVIKRPDSEDAEAKALMNSWDLAKLKTKKQDPAIAAAAPANATEDPENDDACECDCPECLKGDCAHCSNADCEDPSCEGHEKDNDGDEQARTVAEIERLRAEFELLAH
jgi:ATP-dependent Clp protease protease subunit